MPALWLVFENIGQAYVRKEKRDQKDNLFLALI